MASRRRALWALGVAMVALFGVLLVLDLRMRDTDGPGIVPFELAGSEERAEEIKADWGEDGRAAARVSLWLDFPYLAAYGSFWALVVAAAGDALRRRDRRRLGDAARVLRLFPLAAAACDAVENVFLLLLLGGHATAAAAPIAFAFASAKFAATGVALAYLLAGLAVIAASRRAHFRT